MNILLVQDHLRSGGAARAAGRWAGLLRSGGHRVTQAAGDEAGPDAVLVTGKPPRGIARLREWCQRVRPFREGLLKSEFSKLLHEAPWDLIWFHNLAGGQKWGWGEEMIGMARAHAPVLWTLHDMWALGEGSESYWEEGSVVESGRGQGAGPLGSEVQGCEGGKVNRGGSRAERVCREGGKYPVTLAAPSKWLAALTKKTTGQECIFLPNPIDLKIFSPGDRRQARRKLGLPEEGLLVLAGAESLQDRRKGFDLLEDAWSRPRPPDTTLVLFGRHGQNKSGQIHLGSLQEESGLVAAYQAADLYVHPARQENAPCTIQESLACGTPVLAFGVGGIPEMIRPGGNGLLAEKVDGSALADDLGKALRDPRQLEAMRAGCRQLAEKDYRPDVLLEKFQRLGSGFSQQ